ncbi:MAG TPA: transcriptional regulator [Micrococcales bacterium]|uniref:ArsR/SmtB family transcription factor n=1 Tax=Miniimonas arenae TaxID=676201 RepID=UPI000EEE2EC6|nr:metalloregulator ArsR/SmtB family transcription factor [Miniimonas arenae]HCX85952.1 transcriptional regulator [Micrococcales bacterium]
MVRQSELDDETQAFLKVVASPVRQAIVLLFAHGSELSVNEVAERAEIPQSTASEQLAVLRHGGVLSARRDGRITLYRADRDGISRALGRLQRFLESCC